MIHVAYMDWQELDQAYNLLRIQKSESRIWDHIEKGPITAYDFKELVKNGWKVCRELEYDFGRLNRKKLEILIRKSLVPGYQRDLTLFHEVGHLFYEPFDNSLNDDENEIIVEWIARKARATPALLRHAIKNFNLEPAIYDNSSYRAFTKRKIKSLEEVFPTIMMDSVKKE